MEIWKPIEGTEGIYEVSNTGKVRNINYRGCGYTRYLKISTNDWGYNYVIIKRNGKRGKQMIHRLLAEIFIPNPDEKPEVNHIDGVKTNNCIDNLEWVTKSENVQHAYDTGLNENNRKRATEHMRNIQRIAVEKNKRKIVAIDNKTGNRTNFDSIEEACSKLGVHSGNIYKVIKNKRNHTGGYKFEYID